MTTLGSAIRFEFSHLGNCYQAVADPPPCLLYLGEFSYATATKSLKEAILGYTIRYGLC